MSDDYAADKQIRQDEILSAVAATFIEHLGAKTVLGTTSQRYADELASKLWVSVYLDPGLYFDIKHDVATLEKIERATRAVSSALDEMTVLAEDALTEACEHQVLLDYLSSARALCAAATKTKRGIENSPQSRERVSLINMEAIKVVAFARRAWRWVGETVPPDRSLNPASPFGKFLADLMVAIEVNANAQAAYRAWTLHLGGK